MVAVDDDLVIGNVGDAEDHVFFAFIPYPLKSHADFDVLGEDVLLFHQHELFVVIAESVFGLQLEAEAVANALALQSFLDRGKNAVVTAVQIDQRIAAIIDGGAIAVGDGVGERDDGVLEHLHKYMFRSKFLKYAEYLGHMTARHHIAKNFPNDAMFIDDKGTAYYTGPETFADLAHPPCPVKATDIAIFV